MKMFHGMGSGIRLTLSFKELKDKFVPVPSLPEQQAIVDYLDNKTALIDQAIEGKLHQQTLLREAKQVLIAEAVTKGLDKNVDLKKSGTSWLGEIPEHWEVKKARFLFEKLNRPICEGYETVTCFRDGQVTLRKNRRTTGFTESLQENGYQGVMPGDLVIHQMDAFAGSTGVSDSEGKCTPVYSVCKPIDNNANVYYYAFIVRLMGLNGYIKSLYKGIRERSSDFRFETFAQLFLPLPPLPEQQAIVTYIESKTEKIDHMIATLDTQVEQLRAYRQRLIADVVTGQKKVC